MTRFNLYAQTNPPSVVEFEREHVTIGRSSENDLVIECITVSRFQAEITGSPEGIELTNIGRGPVSVNDEPVKSCILQDHDVIAFGSEIFRFELAAIAAEPDIENGDQTVVSTVGGASGERVVGAIPAVLVPNYESGSGQNYLLNNASFSIGRAEECDIVVEDQRVSREHVVIEHRSDGYHLVRKTPHQVVLVNGSPVDECRLYNNDNIEIFMLSLVFKSFDPTDQRELPADEQPEAPAAIPRAIVDQAVTVDHTTVQSQIQVRREGPRLVSHSKKGSVYSYQLSPGRNRIGRDPDCEIVIVDDTSVSRMHAEVTRRDRGHTIEPHSGCVLLLNGKSAARTTRIYSGDALQLGDTLLTFLSELRDDARPVKPWISKVLLPITAALVIALIVGGLYRYVWVPGQMDNRIEFARTQILIEDEATGLVLLEQLYREELSNEQMATVTSLMADAVSTTTDLQVKRGFLEPAKYELELFLRKYGAQKNVDVVWEKLNEVRFMLGQKFELGNKPKDALTEYLAIDNDSQYYGPAQKGISNIWKESQSGRGPSAQTGRGSLSEQLAELLAEADALFSRQQYLSPANSNAYAVYTRILSADPANAVALERIEKMKSFYRQQGDTYCRNGNREKAETYFRRFLIIAPEDTAMQAALGRLDQCESLSPSAPRAELAASRAGQSSENKLKAQKLLQEEGVNSEWIVDFLFEGEEGEAGNNNAETPW